MTTASAASGATALTGRSWAWPPVSAALFLAVAAAFVGLFYRWFSKQGEFSAAHLEDWGHSFMVPAITGYLIWQRRATIAATPIRPFWPGLLPVALGIVSYLTLSIGRVPGTHMNQGAAVLLTVFGIALTLFGVRCFRWLSLPLAFLAFGITIAEAVMLAITWPLQLIASQGAYVMLALIGRVAGFQVGVEGNVLTVITAQGREFPLNVAEACSGMRMVVAFIALGAAVAVIACRLWWQRIAVFVLAVPVALLMNIIRVAVLGLLTLGNPDLAQGEAHTLIGTLLLIPGLGVFLVVVWALNAIVVLPSEPKPAPVRGFTPRLAGPTAGALLALLSVSALGTGYAISAYKYHLTKLPIEAPGGRTLASNLPRETDSWRTVGADRVESAEVLEELGTRNYVNRYYAEKNPAPGARPRVIELHAAYYTGQIDTVPHVPERCFVGGGLQQASSARVVPLDLDRSRWIPDPGAPAGEEPVFTARTSTRWSDSRGARVRLPRGIESVGLRASGYQVPRVGEIFAGYFFIANGGIATSANDVRLLAFDLTDDYAFYLKVQFNGSSAQGIGSPEELAEVASDLLDELLPDLMMCVPDWVEVTQGRYPPDRTTTPAG
jgi:exosortase